jgi:mRNA interferase MazF
MQKGEIWLINLDPSIGAEIKKTRPAVIISEDSIGVLPLRIVVPITEWKERFSIAPWMVKIEPSSENGLNKPSAADAFQIRSISTQRMVRRLGKITQAQQKQVLDAIKTVTGIE